jgi:nucleotide-binding universal stress UspA family protein
MKVLVGVDGSSNSFAAVEFIGRLLSPDRDELVLLFATPSLALAEEFDSAIEQRARSVLSKTVLEAALERLPQNWRSVAITKEASGSAGGALLEGIKEHGAELAVVGFRGTTSIWEQFLLGSVSRTVVHSATVPVLVVKTPRPEMAPSQSPSGSVSPQLKVLVAYDGSPASEATAPLLGKFTWPTEVEGWAATVVRPMFPYDLPDWVKIQPRDPDVAAMAAAWEQEHQQNLKAAQGDLERFRAKLPACFAKHDVIVVEGQPAEQIVAQLTAKGIDMAVLGNHGSGRLERLLLGSTTEQVLASAPCSTLIVR